MSVHVPGCSSRERWSLFPDPWADPKSRSELYGSVIYTIGVLESRMEGDTILYTIPYHTAIYRIIPYYSIRVQNWFFFLDPPASLGCSTRAKLPEIISTLRSDNHPGGPTEP